MGSCCFDYSDPVDVHRAVFRRARKQYRCCECGIRIEAGEVYERAVLLQDGHWYDYRTCEPCADLREALAEVDCPMYEGLSECYTNYLTEAPGVSMSVRPGTHAARLAPSYFEEEDND